MTDMSLVSFGYRKCGKIQVPGAEVQIHVLHVKSASL